MASILSVSPTTRTENSAGTPDHPKRRAEHPEQTNSEEPAPNRIKARDDEKKRLNEHITDALVRSAEMLHRCGRRHAFGLIIVDATVWIWWFDRQGAIQSTGINFIEDLPRLMVFLFAIQRFPLADWGFDVKLDPSIPLRHHSNTPLTQQPAEYEVDGNGKFKVGFNRPNAAEIIERARKIPGLSDRLPYVFGSRDMDSIGTRRISDKLGISSSPPRPPRVFRTIILEYRMNLSILFKGVDAKLPRNMLGWDTGTVELLSAITITPEPSANGRIPSKPTKLRVSTTDSTEIIAPKSATLSEGVVSYNIEKLRLPVYNRYASSCVFEFGGGGIMGGAPDAIAVLWLKDLVIGHYILWRTVPVFVT
ncbi:hypothetical protein RSAG8_13097, partial [Rhizoctonia solani AG-8 WAC10335]